MLYAIVLTITLGITGGIGASSARHWSFMPAIRPPVPTVKNRAWVHNPIDAFVLASLEKKGISPSSPPDRRTLLRRVTFDLIGLPPTQAEIAAYVADKSPDAYEKVVRRLLASPQYGERWGQHWLDVVRFAESNGYEHDADRPQAWRYRDWVIRSLNEDKPYNEFLKEQVAGDLMLGPQASSSPRSITEPIDGMPSHLPGKAFDLEVATGFLRAGPQHITGGNLDTRETRQEWLTEAVLGIGNGVLGLTIGCARCHDHKYDPITQVEYYRLQSFFAATTNRDRESATPDQKKAYEAALKGNKDKIKPIERQIAEIEKPYRELVRKQKIARLPAEYQAALGVDAAKRTPQQKKLVSETNVQLNISWDELVAALNPTDKAKRAGLRKQIFSLEMQEPDPLPAAACVADELNPAEDSHLLVRGDPHKPALEVQPGLPECLASPNQQEQSNLTEPYDKAPPRMALARWLTDPNNPLTSRVIVNRLWHYHFGRGIVSTPNDFGKNGARPTHPELLDWLASELTRSGGVVEGWSIGKTNSPTVPYSKSPWSLKRLHYLMVTSNTYRQASDYDGPKFNVDPENKLLWRMNRKRLDAEALRDSILAVSGSLNPQTGGPSVRIPLEPEVYATIFSEYEPDNLWPVTLDPRQHNRRSVYLFRKRNVRLPMLAVFDQPDFITSCAARGQSVHALQALTMVNSEFMQRQAQALARRVLADDRRSTMDDGAVRNEDGNIRRLFVLTLGRQPSVLEQTKAQRFLTEQAALLRSANGAMNLHARSARISAWTDLCLATLNLNEFVYLR